MAANGPADRITASTEQLPHRRFDLLDGLLLTYEVTLKTPLPGSGWLGHSYGGFGEDTGTSARMLAEFSRRCGP
jgi:hypothetical protein